MRRGTGKVSRGLGVQLLLMQVSRPDGKPDSLGLKVLDEPAAVQSDPSVLAMQLRQASKQASPPGNQHQQAGLSKRDCFLFSEANQASGDLHDATSHSSNSLHHNNIAWHVRAVGT